VKKSRLVIGDDVDNEDSRIPRRFQHGLGRLAHMALAEHGAFSHGGFLHVHGQHSRLGAIEI